MPFLKRHIPMFLFLSTEKNIIPVGGQQTFNLTATEGFSGTVKGKVRIYYHTKDWTGLAPVDFPFCLAIGDDAPAAVTYPVSLENFPNPVLEKTTITFSIP